MKRWMINAKRYENDKSIYTAKSKKSIRTVNLKFFQNEIHKET